MDRPDQTNPVMPILSSSNPTQWLQAQLDSPIFTPLLFLRLGYLIKTLALLFTRTKASTCPRSNGHDVRSHPISCKIRLHAACYFAIGPRTWLHLNICRLRSLLFCRSGTLHRTFSHLPKYRRHILACCYLSTRRRTRARQSKCRYPGR